MDISVTSSQPRASKNSALVVFTSGNSALEAGTIELDTNTVAYLKKVLKRGDLAVKCGESLLLHDVPGCHTERLLLISLGESGKHSDATIRQACQGLAKAVHRTGAAHLIMSMPQIGATNRQPEWLCRTLVLELLHAAYRFTGHQRQKKPARSQLKKLTIQHSDRKTANRLKKAASEASGINAGNDLARDLANLAPNICTPDYLAAQARAMGKKFPALKVTVLDESRMEKLGMGALLSVGRGSRQGSKLICIEYRGAAAKKPPVVFLGKGITFDTGGISIKPSASMDEMKYDMCGAASVFGVMQACAEIAPECNLVAVIAAAENMPDGNASRPGDVITTMSGQSVEILNTDAEGRLVLCDALTWIEKFKPAAVIDVATLTGACIIALGHVCSAVLGNDQDLINQILSAGQESGDKTWQLPLWDEYQRQLDSNFADMANIGGRPAGTITAACFLSRFAEAYPWAHLDIAGIAWKSGENKGATGRPVPLLMNYLMTNHCA